MPSRTLEQERARYALSCIRKHIPGQGAKDGEARKYGTLVRRLPTMVLQNGLGQALAFLLADAEGREDKPSRRLYDELEIWLHGAPGAERPDRVYQNGRDLIDALMEGTRDDYRRAQMAALGLLVWMRKFADAYLPKGDA